MRLIVEEVEFKLKWAYNTVETGRRARKVTDCVVTAIAREGKSFGHFVGTVRFNPHDVNYSKQKGRELSLARAIGVLPRETRRRIWQAYWQAMDDFRARTDTNRRLAAGIQKELDAAGR